MSEGGFFVATFIKNDQFNFMKLMAAGMMLSTAKAKLEYYMSKKENIYNQMIEDDHSLEMLTAYYLEQSDDLEKCAADSIFTADEAEKAFYVSIGEEHGTESD